MCSTLVKAVVPLLIVACLVYVWEPHMIFLLLIHLESGLDSLCKHAASYLFYRTASIDTHCHAVGL
jgi:hypothetical protein